MHQPLLPSLPALRKPDLQRWQTTTLSLEQQLGTGVMPDMTASGAQATAEGSSAIISVIQAWHPTGIHFPPVCASCIMFQPRLHA